MGPPHPPHPRGGEGGGELGKKRYKNKLLRVKLTTETNYFRKSLKDFFSHKLTTVANYFREGPTDFFHTNIYRPP